MSIASIAKVPDTKAPPNMIDYDQARATFSWSEAQQQLAGLPDGRGLNIAWEAVGKHVAAGRGANIAFRFLRKDGAARDVTFKQLDEQTNRFASALTKLGVGKGDVVVSLSPRIEALYVAATGAMKCGAVFCPLFSAFEPEPIQTRLVKGEARVLVTTSQLYRRKKLADLRADIPSLEFTTGGKLRPAES